ncbi:unnamed protein product [Gordionus sp. m RMFG-2023]
MSAKRQATTQLNKDNWDQDPTSNSDNDDTVNVQNKDLISKRKILVAKRRSGGSSSYVAPQKGLDTLSKTYFNSHINEHKQNDNIHQPFSNGFNPSDTRSIKVQNLHPRQSFSDTSSFASTKPLPTTLKDTKDSYKSLKFVTNYKPGEIMQTFRFNSQQPIISNTSVVSKSLPTFQLSNHDSQNLNFKNSFVKPYDNGLNNNFNSNFIPSNLTSTSPKDSLDDQSNVKSEALYYSCVTKLNSSVSKWISAVIQIHPTGDLTLIFEKYKSYLEKLRFDFDVHVVSLDEDNINHRHENNNNSPQSQDFNNLDQLSYKFQPEASIIKIDGNHVDHSERGTKNDSPKKPSTESKIEFPPPFSFFGKNEPSTLQNSIGFHLTNNKDGTTSNLAPSIDNKPFTFGFHQDDSYQGEGTDTIDNHPMTSNLDEQGDVIVPNVQSEEPIWQEDNCLITLKCKLYRKDAFSQFKDVGLGFCYLKQNRKLQLLVRASNASGTILLNATVTKGKTPVTLSGKNSLLIVLPSFEDSSCSKSPTTFLIRVKAEKDAIELYQNLT